MGEDISQSKFKFAFEKSISAAIRQTYASKFPQFAQSPTASSIYDKYDVFDEILSAPVTKNRFEVFDIKYKFYGEESSKNKVSADSFDELLGLLTPVQYLETGSSNVNVLFKIKFDDKLQDSNCSLKILKTLYFHKFSQQVKDHKLKETDNGGVRTRQQ